MIRTVILEGATRKKDKSVSLRFTTSLEQSSEEFMEVDKLLDTHGILYFSSRDTLTQQEVDEIEKVDIEIEGKTKSQKLRNVLYILWTQSDKERSKSDFYAHKMDEVIEHFKSKLV